MQQSTKTVPWFYKAFFFVHVTIISLWSLPFTPREVRENLRPAAPIEKFYQVNDSLVRNSPIRYYLLSTGTWQYWDMFAPNPLSMDSYIDCRVTFEDGSAMIWPYPRMATLNIFEKYLQERFRKNIERTSEPSNSFLWPAFCNRVALQAYRLKRKIPIEVKLIKRFRQIGPPQNDPDVGIYREITIFSETIDTSLLKDKIGGKS